MCDGVLLYTVCYRFLKEIMHQPYLWKLWNRIEATKLDLIILDKQSNTHDGKQIKCCVHDKVISMFGCSMCCLNSLLLFFLEYNVFCYL